MGKSKDLATGETRFVNTAGDTMTGTLVAGTRLQVGDSSITQGYTQANFGYVADFQATTGSQTCISIAPPNVSSLGDNGTVIGEDGSDTYITQRNDKNIKLGTQNLNRLIIDGSGYVTMPYQPSFAAAVSANNWTTSSAADCPFDNELFDNGGHYNSSNYTFTAPVAGRYFTSFFLNRYSDSRFDIAFMVNGVARHGLEVREAGAGQWHMEGASVILSLSANDAVKLRITGVISTGTAIFDGGGSFYDVFSMHLLS